MARGQGIMEKHMNDRNETFPETNRASVEKGMAYFNARWANLCSGNFSVHVSNTFQDLQSPTLLPS